MDEVNPYTAIKNLKPFKTSWCIQVKILHAWNHYTKGSGMSYEMMLADEDGNKIQAGIKKEHLLKLQRYVKIGHWTIIEEFSVTKASGLYRSTTHPYRINIQSSTRFSNSPTISDEIWLDLVNFNDVLSGTLDQNKLVNVIGQLVNVGEIQLLDVQGKPTKKIDFQLRDTDDNRLPCSLWGKFADQIHKVSKESVGGIVICLIRWAKLGHYKEIRSISNAFDASEVFINPILTEVEEFKNLLPSDGLALTIMEPKPRFQPLRVREERSKQFERKTIAELKASFEVEKVKIICSILSIDLDYSWYYYAHIKCNKKVFKSKKTLSSGAKKIIYRCDKCATDVTSIEARYWLHLDIMDNTGESKLMLFDSFVEPIIGCPATELLDVTNEQIDEPQPLPDVVKNIIGKTYQFLVCVEQDNISRGNDEYKVAEVLTSQNINQALPINDSVNPVDHSSISSNDQVLMLTNNSEKEDNSQTLSRTPLSKRKEIVDDGSDQSSTSKKQCTKDSDETVTDVTVIDVDNPNDWHEPKFFHKLEEAAQGNLKEVKHEREKIVLKNIKVEKIDGKNAPK
ncbi:Nucleic acid-binding, OB-fold-like protein [Arabidopsis thaliana]|uniref:Nucleic acid-binding, OB-fold-like protein n=2 Tax=Arabidopsis thaliana TaxID=3702 RepID=Q9C926_ARATH|nr:Nucleic acid-binding, OB-fold-like protein [Arabidopsis thaliana]AAG52278.1 putative replication protein; 94555-97079 [Arabidopsis thaliana]AEE32871.1 Nucleic acid-binding, OB-fold-like protein [Arabidopsis thaliana]|eukprot:NP_175703.1 Nucleic acid-binding, OB-fold-like protein [Arabidopsis thaliana]